MNKEYEVFDAAKLTLSRGVNLIEASAGTGKTYAIAMIVLRALVELDIPVDKMLIVTFTKAATEELKVRIRQRLAEVRNLLSPEMHPADNFQDVTLLTWLDTIYDRKAALQKIQHGLVDIDRIGIFTIHGFCQRMLAEQALESGQLFDLELVGNVDKIRMQVAEDFWRRRVYSLSELACGTITAKFSSPEKLLETLRESFGGRNIIEPKAKNVEEIVFLLEKCYQALLSWWKSNHRELLVCFSEAIANGYFKKQFTQNYPAWIDRAGLFLSGNESLNPGDIEHFSSVLLQDQLNGTKLRGDAKKAEFLSGWPLANQLAEDFVKLSEELLLNTRLHLAMEIRGVVQNRMEMQGKMGFDDLIKRMADSLEGENGPLLKRVIGERYTVALIDEFQDTDMDQYTIFSSLFSTKEHYLYLIGDPKQAIYKFRGADIYSYFAAKKSANRFLTLNKNYRSHPSLIEEVNRLFSAQERPFWYEETVLSYRHVLAGVEAGHSELLHNERSLAGVRYCQLPENPTQKSGRWTSAEAARWNLSYTVAEIISLLHCVPPIKLKAGEHSRDFDPTDIAILVRSNRQAEEYRDALVSSGVPAVVTSKQSVFLTKDCQDLYFVLAAIVAPGRTPELKTAMATAWFGLNGDQLYKLWQDEDAMNQWHERFYAYNLLWQEKGFLPMMTRLIVEEDVFPCLARKALAERSIVNINQLMELVQQKESEDNLGWNQLLQWLQLMMQGEKEGEESELLLESDENAVQIMTMHGAKGLEFPVVFCPYLWYRSSRLRQEKYQIKGFGQGTEAVIDLGSEHFEQRKQRAIEEEIAEDLRLLYVAVTRAKLCCYIMWADVLGKGTVSDSFQSALGYLLFSSQLCSSAEQRAVFSSLAENKTVQHVLVSEQVSSPVFQQEQSRRALCELKPSARSLYTDWQMSSFSALATLSEYELDDKYSTIKDDTAETILWPELPAGPNFGNLVHDLLECMSFSEFADKSDNPELLSQLEKQSKRYGITVDPVCLAKFLQQIVCTPFADVVSSDEFSLAGLAEEKCVKEMPFYFQVTHLMTEKINEILQSEPTFAPLGKKEMRGYLTGYIDLIFQKNKRYYIVDYKTNYLGSLLSDYHPEKLTAAMQAHNYGLQYWLYTLVLHRHLTHQLPGYSYSSDFGGVYYLFVRGMAENSSSAGVFSRTPHFELLDKLDNALDGRDG